MVRPVRSEKVYMGTELEEQEQAIDQEQDRRSDMAQIQKSGVYPLTPTEEWNTVGITRTIIERRRREPLELTCVSEYFCSE